MNYYNRLFFLGILIMLSIFMIINPRETVAAASSGFELWYAVVLPALLPFFVVAELLVSVGFAQFLGVILEPIMRPLFKLPGCSSLVVAMGYTSGFPIGAVLTRKLFEEQMLTGNEAERLASFTNNSSPLFILGAVGVGLFQSPLIGAILAVSHYLANLLVGLLWGFTASTGSHPRTERNTKQLFHTALATLKQFSDAHPTTPGKLLGDAIRNSINNLLAIAGFIILFSVLTRMLTVWAIMDVMAVLFSKVFSFLNISYPIAFGMGLGMFEMTLGSKAIALAASENILPAMLATSMVLAFSGFSIIAQVMGILANTPVRLLFYLKSRLLQATLSVFITWGGYMLFFRHHQAITAFTIPVYKFLYAVHAWQVSLWCFTIFFVLIIVLILTSLLHAAFHHSS